MMLTKQQMIQLVKHLVNKKNASVAPSGQHKSKAVTGASTESMVMAAKLAGAAGVQQDLVATVSATLQHSNLEDTESASVGEKSTYKPVVLLSSSGMTPDGLAQWKASLLRSKTLRGGAVSPARASKRNASTLDQDSLEKATKLKARKNLGASSVKGTIQGNSLAMAMGKTAAA